MNEDKTLEQKQKWEEYKKIIAEQVKKKSDEAKEKQMDTNDNKDQNI